MWLQLVRGTGTKLVGYGFGQISIWEGLVSSSSAQNSQIRVGSRLFRVPVPSLGGSGSPNTSVYFFYSKILMIFLASVTYLVFSLLEKLDLIDIQWFRYDSNNELVSWTLWSTTGEREDPPDHGAQPNNQGTVNRESRKPQTQDPR